jgi:hypothetical protein
MAASMSPVLSGRSGSPGTKPAAYVVKSGSRVGSSSPECRRRSVAAVTRAEYLLASATVNLPPGPWDYALRKAFEHLARSRRALQGPPLAQEDDTTAASPRRSEVS